MAYFLPFRHHYEWVYKFIHSLISSSPFAGILRTNKISRAEETTVRITASLSFFRLFYRNYITWTFNCDHLYIYFFISRAVQIYEIHIFIISVSYFNHARARELEKEADRQIFMVEWWYLCNFVFRAHQFSFRFRGDLREAFFVV